MILVRLAQIVTRGEPAFRERAFWYLDVYLPIVPHEGSVVVWSPGGEGRVRKVRVLVSEMMTWRFFPARADGPLVELWLEDRYVAFSDVEVLEMLLLRDGWKRGEEQRALKVKDAP